MKVSFDNILYVGPDYKNHRGGIGAVLEVYSQYMPSFYFIPTLNYQNKFSGIFFFAASIFRYIFFVLKNRRKIKIIHIHGSKGGSVFRKGIVFFIGKIIFKKKIIYHIHAGSFQDYYYKSNIVYKSFCRFILNNSDCVIVLSDKWHPFFLQNFRIKELQVLRNPVMIPTRMDNFHSEDKAELVFLFLGKIADHKGIFDLVELIKREHSFLKGKFKLFIGGNHDVEKLKDIIAVNKLEDVVEYIGWVQNETKQHYLSVCDYFILPTYYEAMPMTILEALSYGKPVISTPVGSIPEIIKDGWNGFLFEPGDMESLNKIIHTVLRDSFLKKGLSENSIKSIQSYSPENVCADLLVIYNKIVVERVSKV